MSSSTKGLSASLSCTQSTIFYYSFEGSPSLGVCSKTWFCLNRMAHDCQCNDTDTHDLCRGNTTCLSYRRTARWQTLQLTLGHSSIMINVINGVSLQLSFYAPIFRRRCPILSWIPLAPHLTANSELGSTYFMMLTVHWNVASIPYLYDSYFGRGP